MSFKVVIHGTSAAIPTKRRKLASQLLIYNYSQVYVLDPSEGIQYTILKRIKKITKIKGILISHFHADHVLGLPGLLMTLNMLSYPGPLLLAGPPGLKKHLEGLKKLYEMELAYEIHMVEVEKSPMQLFENKQLTGFGFFLNHRIPCVGYVFKEKPKLPRLQVEKLAKYQIPPTYYGLLKAGKTITLSDGTQLCGRDFWGEPKPSYSYAFCTDTRPSHEIIPYIEGVDMLYHEATFLHKEQGKAIQTTHTTALEAAQIAKDANAKYLLLGHFSSRYEDVRLFWEEASTIFPNTLLAEDGAVIPIPYHDGKEGE
jgi:ribonuclease Z